VSKLHLGLTAVAVVAVAVSLSGAYYVAAPLSFKKDILTEVMPSVVSGLIAIAAITERATAVLNDIWLGPARAEAEDSVRLANRKIEAANAQAQRNNALAQEAVRTSNNAFFTAFASVLSGPDISALAADVKSSEDQLSSVQKTENRSRLALSFIVALLVSALGVRTLQSLLDASSVTGFALYAFRFVDIVLTAGVLTGGTSGISAITDLLGTYVNASRKRALQ
jgi:hypothetical protein